MSKYRFRKHMETVLNIIGKSDEHPLKFLLNQKGTWMGRWPKEHELSVQAGHAVSRFSGLQERFLVEDAAYNQMFSTPERAGRIIYRSGILIEGVPVEEHTAKYWIQAGYLNKSIVENAEPTLGWV